jgi:ADP-heptose:LPS heptosyltransferase
MSSHVTRQAFQQRHNYWLACASELLRPALVALARRWSPDPPTPPSAWRRGLLLGANHIGDCLYLTPSLAALRRGLPNCEWFVAAPAPACEVLETNPHLSGCVRLDVTTAPKAQVRAELAACGPFDAAVCYSHSRAWPHLLRLARLGIPNRAGYVHKGFSGMITYPVALRHPQPAPSYFRDLVSQLTGQPGPESLRPQVFPTAADRQAAAACWERVGLANGQPVVMAFCTSRQPTGAWPLEQFAETLRLLHARGQHRIVLGGSATDCAALEHVRARAGLDCPVLAGDLSLRSMACFLERCAVVLAPDTGTRHLANAANVPVVFVRNLYVNRVETGAYCPTECDVAPPVEFVPLAEQARWFARIRPVDVVTALMERIAQSAR